MILTGPVIFFMEMRELRRYLNAMRNLEGSQVRESNVDKLRALSFLCREIMLSEVHTRKRKAAVVEAKTSGVLSLKYSQKIPKSLSSD